MTPLMALLASRHDFLARCFFQVRLSDSKLAAQAKSPYFKWWLVCLQYVLVPAIGMHEDATGTMENRSGKKQGIPANGTVHLVPPIVSTLRVGLPIILERARLIKWPARFGDKGVAAVDMKTLQQLSLSTLKCCAAFTLVW